MAAKEKEPGTVEAEPGLAGSLVTGVATAGGFLGLQGPLTDLLLELGASDRMARSLVTIAMVIMPILFSFIGALWARARTVTVGKANNQIEKAALLPASASQASVEKLKV